MQKCNHKYYYRNPISPFHLTNYTIIREKGYLLPTWVWKITCWCFNWMLQLSSGQKWKKCKQTMLFIAMHYWGYRSKVGEDCSSLLASSSSWQLTTWSFSQRQRCLCRWNFPHIPRDFLSFLDWLFCNLWVSSLIVCWVGKMTQIRS